MRESHVLGPDWWVYGLDFPQKPSSLEKFTSGETRRSGKTP
jgi:hypothetical protein